MNLKARVEKLESRTEAERKKLSVMIVFVPSRLDDPDGQIKAGGLQVITCGQRGEDGYCRWERMPDESETDFKQRATSAATAGELAGRPSILLASYRESYPERAT